MCQSQADGGRRCASRTQAAYEDAFEVIESEPDGARRSALVEEHRETLVRHAVTPSGWRDLADRIVALRRDYAAHPASNSGAEAARQAYLVALQLTAIHAQIRNDVDDDLRRRERFTRTPSGPVPDCAPEHQPAP